MSTRTVTRAITVTASAVALALVGTVGPTATPSLALTTASAAKPPPLQEPKDAPEGTAPTSKVRQRADAALRATAEAGKAAAATQRDTRATVSVAPSPTANPIQPSPTASPDQVSPTADPTAVSVEPATFRDAVGAALAATPPATGTTANGRGDYAATPLAASGSWSAGGSSGAFSWTYPVTAPEPDVGPAPDLSMSYSSASVDGRLPNTNNQPSWLGEGWEFANSYVERSYNSCKDDGQSGKYDLCWKTANASMVLNGTSTELVKDDASGAWKLKDDDSSKVELLTGAANGDNDGEHWRVTTTDGTQYYFGKEVLPGAPAGTVTGATWTAPVFGDDSSEPCYTSTTFTANSCTQAWRWNLDYVVDTNGNAMTLWYAKEANSYYKAGASYASYVRGGYLTEIKYGLRATDLFTSAGYKVTFTVSERCIQTGSLCNTLTSTTKQYWPDVPFSSICTTSCTSNLSPTFFTRKRLTAVSTFAWNGTATPAAYQGVDSWAVTHLFLDPGDTGDSTDQSLWVSKIQRTGKAGTAITLPATSFSHSFLMNRVDSTTSGILPLNKPRISTIVTDSGASIVVTYLAAECTAASKPTPDSNTKRCFPTYWYPNGTSTATLDWFHRYPVAKVTVDAGQGSPAVETAYSYDTAGMAWHYDDSPLTTNSRRTWSQARGYAKVTSYVGPTTSPARSKTLEVYLRGMDGDKTSTGTRTVTVTGVKAPAYTDSDQYAGFHRESVTYLGITATLVGGAVNTPWSRQTSTRVISGAPTIKGWLVRTAATMDWTAITGKPDRTRTTSTTFDTLGFASTIDDTGDATTGGASCTTHTYGRNTPANILDTVTRTQALGVRCTGADTATLPATPATPGDVISDTLTLFDSTGAWTPTQTPIKGNPTWTGRTNGYDDNRAPALGSGIRTLYDGLGRPTSVTDSLGRVTTSSYIPTDALPATSGAVVAPLSSPGTRTDVDVRTGAAVKVTDLNNNVTEQTHDALGRLTGVWMPTSSRAGGATADVAFAYTQSNTYGVASSVATTTTASGGATSYEFYDGIGRKIQSQQPTPKGGRLISDLVLDTEGRQFRTLTGVWDSAAPASTRFNTLVSTSPSQVVTTYDGAGRASTNALVSMGTTLYTTTITYTGESARTSAPTGGSAGETFTDALGRTTKIRQFSGTQPTGSYLEAATRYDSRGRADQLTGPDGATWQYTYDLQGRPASTTDPDTGTTSTIYDDVDRVVSTTDAGNQTVTTDYDDLDRPTAKWAGPSGANGSKLASWTYDTLTKGQLTSATSYRGSTPGATGSAYTKTVTGYDAEYNPSTWTLTLPSDDPFVTAGVPATLNYSATLDEGAPTTSTEPAVAGMPAETFTYTYGPLRTPSRISSALANYLYSAYYTEYGEPARLNLRAGATGAYATISTYYDPATRRTTRTAVTDSTHPWMPTDINYTYDNAGNLKELEDPALMGGAGQADTQCFTYDGYRQLDQAWTPTSGDCTTTPTTTGELGGPAAYWNDYDHNTDGSRSKLVTQTPSATTTTTYSYGGTGNPTHSLASVTGGPAAGTYGYNQIGATTSRPGPAGQQTLTWDESGRLQTLAQPDADTSSTATTEMVYDAGGALLERRTSDDDGDSVLYLGATEVHLPKVDGTAGPLTAQRYYSVAGQTVGVRSATNGAPTATLTWLAGDRQGTTTLTIDAATLDLAKRYTDPFGQRRGTGTTWIDDKLFLNRPADDATSLTHIGAREYDPAVGRFISVDPVLDATSVLSLNGYTYGNDNPGTFSDPTGTKLCADSCQSGDQWVANGKDTKVKGGKPKTTDGTPPPPKTVNLPPISKDSAGRIQRVIRMLVRNSGTNNWQVPETNDNDTLRKYLRTAYFGGITSEQWIQGLREAGALLATTAVAAAAISFCPATSGASCMVVAAVTGTAAGCIDGCNTRELVIDAAISIVAIGGARALASGGSLAPAANAGTRSIEDLLRPGGLTIGKAGTDDTIREITGGLPEAEAMFQQLSQTGTIVSQTSKLTRVALPDGGGFVQLRTVMSRSPNTAATIDINIPGLDITKLKYNP